MEYFTIFGFIFKVQVEFHNYVTNILNFYFPVRFKKSKQYC
jgi:hypothetical protein